MFDQVFRGGRRSGLRLCIALGALGAMTSWTRGAAAQRFVNGGYRWVGTARACVAPASWTATPMFQTAGLPDVLAGLCVYEWTGGMRPTALDVATLVAASGAQEMTEDVPVVLQSAPF
jgi:hypothetical protein